MSLIGAAAICTFCLWQIARNMRDEPGWALAWMVPFSIWVVALLVSIVEALPRE